MTRVILAFPLYHLKAVAPKAPVAALPSNASCSKTRSAIFADIARGLALFRPVGRLLYL